MIFTDRIITVRKGESKINEPIIIYRGDYELEVRFTIMNSKFKFMSGTNLIETENAAYGQLAILTPYGGNIFSEIAKCNEGTVTFVLTEAMLDQIEEVGLYSFQIRLFDHNKESRVSIPPVEFGIEVREPITSEDHDNSVNNAIVGYSIAKIADALNEEVPDTFNSNGDYNKTIWETGDRITEGKLNKIEDAIDTINKNAEDEHISMNKKITSNFKVLDSTKADTIYVDEQIAKKQLTGASVDTSVLVFKTDFEPVKEFVESTMVYENQYVQSNQDHCTMETMTLIQDESDGEYHYVEFTCTASNPSAARSYNLKRKADELSVVTVYIEIERGQTCFVGLGSTFYWPNMVRKTPGNPGSYVISFYNNEIPTTVGDADLSLFIGVSNYNDFKAKFRIEYTLKSVAKVNANSANFALEADEAKHALTADSAGEAINATFAKNAGGLLIPRNNMSVQVSSAQTITQNGMVYTLTKTAGLSTPYYYIFYVRIDCPGGIEELNRELNLNYRYISGKEPTQYMISTEATDWNPNNGPIGFDGTKPVNVYQRITNSSYASKYTGLTRVFLMICYDCGDVDTAVASSTRIEISPIMDDPTGLVKASNITESLYDSLIADAYLNVERNIYKIPIGIKVIPFEDYSFREGGGTSGQTKLTRKEGGWVNCAKTTDVTGSNYAGVYIRIQYDSLDDLDGSMLIRYVDNSGLGLTNHYVMYEIGDWSPGTKGIVNLSVNKEFNLKELLLGADANGCNYAERKVLYFCLVHYRASGHPEAYDFDFKVEFAHADSEVVRANDLSDDLRVEINEDALQYVQNNIGKISIGLTRYAMDRYQIRDNTGNYCRLEQNGDWIKFIKDNDDVGTRYAGVYLRIDYGNIDELDGLLTIHHKVNQGADLTQRCILYGVTDWGSGASQGVIGVSTNQSFNLKEKLLASGLGYENRKYLYIALVCYNSSGNSGRFDYDYKVEFIPNNMQPVVATELSEGLMKELREEFESIGDGGKYITCWGDSLTAGGGWTSTLQSLSGLTVYNGGTGGENVRTITARQGGDVMMINDITIPAERTAVLIRTRAQGGIPTQLGRTVTPLLQGGAHVNPCYIGDIEGTLRWTGNAYNDANGTWTFTRSKAGEEVKITRPTAIRTDFDINKNDPKVMIIFMGQNGGYTDIPDLINQHRLMIEHSNCKDFVVLGLSSGSAALRKDYEDAMKKEFGRRFISLREYLSTPIYDSNGEIISCYGLEDAGLEMGTHVYNGVTYVSKDEIATGTVPHQLLSDAVHYNNDCKTVIGKMLYKKLKELNMI